MTKIQVSVKVNNMSYRSQYKQKQQQQQQQKQQTNKNIIAGQDRPLDTIHLKQISH